MAMLFHSCPVDKQNRYLVPAGPWIVTPKLDGFRCEVYACELHTRSGNRFANRNLDDHLSELIGLSKSTLLSFDCELYSPSLTFPELQSVLQSRSADIPADLKAYVFDALTISEFYDARRSAHYEDRLTRAKRIIDQYHPAHVVCIDHQPADGPRAVRTMFRQITRHGGEGIVARRPDSPYRHARLPVDVAFKLRLDSIPERPPTP
jgi:ATP-dependent DNA ligase